MAIIRPVLFIACLMFFVSVARAAPEFAVTRGSNPSPNSYGGSGDSWRKVTPTQGLINIIRVNRVSSNLESYSAALIWKNQKAIQKGDLLVAEFQIGRRSSDAPSLKLDITFEENTEPFAKSITTSAPVDSASFQRYAIPFFAQKDYAVGAAYFQIRYGLVKQQFDVADVAVVNHRQIAGEIPAQITQSFAYYYPGRKDPNAAWRKKAMVDIDENRKAKMIVRAVDASGKPVANANIKIRQTRSAFTWSTAVSALSLVCQTSDNTSSRPCSNTDSSGGETLTSEDYITLRKLLRANFENASFYNDLKWPDWRRDPKLASEGMAWLKQNKISYSRGHALIWPGFQEDEIMPADLINESTPPSRASTVIADHFKKIVTTYKGRIPEWDVINEPFSENDIQGRLAVPGVPAKKGKLSIYVVSDWFKLARQLDPKAKLFLNDYSIFENVTAEARAHDVALVKYIKRLGAPIDGVGFQAHFGHQGPVFTDLQTAIELFNPYVERFSVTEFDFLTIDPALQADLMADVMTFIFSQPKFQTFQIWGMWDGDHWLGNAAIYNKDWTLKPSGKVWLNLTQKTWRTNVSRTTDKNGQTSLLAFFGDYEITVTAKGRTCKYNTKFSASRTINVSTKC